MAQKAEEIKIYMSGKTGKPQCLFRKGRGMIKPNIIKANNAMILMLPKMF